MEDRRVSDVEFKEAIMHKLSTLEEKVCTVEKLSKENSQTLREYTIIIRTVRWVGLALFLLLTTQWDRLAKLIGGQ